MLMEVIIIMRWVDVKYIKRLISIIVLMSIIGLISTVMFNETLNYFEVVTLTLLISIDNKID